MTAPDNRELFPIAPVGHRARARSCALALIAAFQAATGVSAEGAGADPEPGTAIAGKPRIFSSSAMPLSTARNARIEVIVVKAGAKGEEADKPIIAGSGEAFRDCKEVEVCPEMVVVPSSPPGFLIGSPESEQGHKANETLHPVTIAAFAVGRFEVSVAEYKACVSAGGCRPAEWLEPGGQHNVETGVSNYYKTYGAAVTGDRQPVTGISHDDAAAYAAWLAKTTGKPYRLLSEAEWEHAARAGTTTAYWWGNDVNAGGKVRANCRGCGSEWDGRSLAPVDAFEPNAWGLYNVHGNVWEWVADFYCNAYEAGPKDGSARLTDDCLERDGEGLRVFRGGSGFYEAAFARAASRLRNFADFRNVSVGFRVARTLV